VNQSGTSTSTWTHPSQHFITVTADTAGVRNPLQHSVPRRSATRTTIAAGSKMMRSNSATASHPQPIIWEEGNHNGDYQSLKRAMDVVGSLSVLVLLSPVLLTVLVVLAVTTRGKPFFSQQRVGLCGRRFRMFKFRTMRLDADKVQHLIQNEKDGPIFKNRHDPRITRLGRWLRKTSIDELPQLLNVLLGDMSLVGPRPPVPKEVAQYKPWQRRRLSVKPGLTCLWQVSGRSKIGFEDWVRMDLWYIRHQTVWTDVKLLVKTPLTVVMCKGAY
jgi:lipopolysaccharide/colanic/teichoic acid biosynthesis glycosyltransferase